MTCHNPTEVVTTVILTNDDNPHWTAEPMPRGMVMLQSCDMNFGIVGTPRQLATMFKRQSVALAEYITRPTPEYAEEDINVG